MVGYPRRLTDAPRHQQNRQNAAIGTIAIARKNSPPPAPRQRTPPSPSRIHRERHRSSAQQKPTKSTIPIGDRERPSPLRERTAAFFNVLWHNVYSSHGQGTCERPCTRQRVGRATATRKENKHLAQWGGVSQAEGFLGEHETCGETAVRPSPLSG